MWFGGLISGLETCNNSGFEKFEKKKDGKRKFASSLHCLYVLEHCSGLVVIMLFLSFP